jgi:hypothetical protein
MNQSRLQMRMRTDILRPVVEGVDSYGHPLPEKLQTVSRGVPCFAWYQTEVAERQNNESYAAIGRVRLIMPLVTSIAESDVLDGVSDRRGRVVVDARLRVESVARRPDHVAVVAREVRGGRP